MGVLHGSFTVTRDINAAPARVWDAYANADLRSGGGGCRVRTGS